MTRPKGMAPQAFTAYIKACYQAGVNPSRVMQTIGNAPASAGVHKRDGYTTVNGTKYEYCAAIDLGVRDGDYDFLSDAEIKKFLDALGDYGFAAWFRNWPGNKHIHAVYVGIYMKMVLRDQVRDYFAHKNGLSGHGWEGFWRPADDIVAKFRPLFVKYNPMQRMGADDEDSKIDDDLQKFDLVEIFKFECPIEFDPDDSEDE